MVPTRTGETIAPEEPIGVFTSDEVLRITGISRRRLAYWLDHGVLVADVDQARGRGKVRLFSFVNLVEVRVAVWLRDKVSLQLIRKIVRRLREQDGWERPLADVTFGVVEVRRGTTAQHEVLMQRPDGSWETLKGQRIMEIFVPLQRFASELEKAAEAERRRKRRIGQIERRRGALGSTPVLAGTRVPVKAIWALHKAGYDRARILKNYPGLEPADIDAALAAEAQRRASTRRERSA